MLVKDVNLYIMVPEIKKKNVRIIDVGEHAFLKHQVSKEFST